VQLDLKMMKSYLLSVLEGPIYIKSLWILNLEIHECFRLLIKTKGQNQINKVKSCLIKADLKL